MQPRLLGILIILFGLILLLNNLDIMDINIGSLIVTYWPVLLIVWGIESITRRVKGSSPFGGILSGLILLGLGTLFLGRNVGLYELDLSIIWKVIWPLVVVLIGWSILRGAIKSSSGTHFAFMSGIELKSKGWKLDNGNFLAFMGGVDMDLTMADIPEHEVTLNLTAVMGGIEVRVPENLAVECQGSAILGGIEFLGEESGGVFSSRKFQQKGDLNSNKKLVIKSTVLMGGIKVKY